MQCSANERINWIDGMLLIILLRLLQSIIFPSYTNAHGLSSSYFSRAHFGPITSIIPKRSRDSR